MRVKNLYAMLIVVSMFTFLASCQITETDTDTETESATVGTAEAAVWLYFPDLEKRPYESIVLMGNDIDEAIHYLNSIEFKDANGYPEEPLTEMYVAADAVRGYTVTYLVDSIGQVWVFIDEDCLWVGATNKEQEKEGTRK